MSVEIERKFLVKNKSFISESHAVLSIKQGFLNSNKNRVVRVRVLDDLGYLTVKGVSSNDGTSRYEWEKEIALKEAEELLTLCETGVIIKKRFLIKKGTHTFEVDVFEGDNTGLIVAEIELDSAEEIFIIPNWLGEEVTGDSKYYNSSLSKLPYTKWA
ncbi:MAG: CYTH domain-containing protein [Flavobacteriaceae bacterium]|nr:CYTH domain-containing protein [Flavobacteriaceae bacterium]